VSDKKSRVSIFDNSRVGTRLFFHRKNAQQSAAAVNPLRLITVVHKEEK
jgi:hypothetical protein